MALVTFELEALGSSADILKGYDAANDQWRFSRDNDFWKAVNHAHDLGRRGQGQRVAIIDSGCDFTIRRLERRIGKFRDLVGGVDDRDPLGHGTAVALLISEVSPQSILDIYRVVAADGTIDESAMIDAIAEAAKSNATVINLSMGRPREWLPDFKDSPWKEVDHFKQTYISEKTPCPICAAASAAAESGKLVFAAVGNRLLHTYCPARAHNVVAVGFQRQQRIVPTPQKEISMLVPDSDQSVSTDIMLLGAPGVLGSSFACPLYAGVGALGLKQGELWSFIASYRERVFPLMFHAQVDTAMGGPANAPSDLIEEIDCRYKKSLALLPHSHCAAHSQLNPDLPRLDPNDCGFCGVFADLQYINIGYWLFHRKRLHEAIDFLRAARALCPWSAKPVAIEGSAHAELGNISKAIENYEIAIKMRPDHQPYRDGLKALRLAAAVGSMSDVAICDWRRRVVERMNRYYYRTTAALLLLHLVFPRNPLAKWMLILPIVVGAIFAAQLRHDSKKGMSLLQEVADLATRIRLELLSRFMRRSSVCFLLSATGMLLILLVHF
jgi:tetratricopeptide (TPR) repeat protein